MVLLIFASIRAVDYIIHYVFLRYNTSYVLMPRNDDQLGTNSLGLRGPEPSLEKGESLGLFIGDSFTMGMGVREEDGFVRATERILREEGHKVEHINAGIAGYSPANSLGLLQHLGETQNPDYVVFTLYSNDIFDLGDNVFISALLEKELKKPHVALLHFFAPRTTSYFYYSQLAALGNQLSLNHNMTLDRVHENLQKEESGSGGTGNPGPVSAEQSSDAAPGQSPDTDATHPESDMNRLKLMLFLEEVKKLAEHAGIDEQRFNEWMQKNQSNVSLAMEGKVNLVEVLTPLFFPQHFEQCIDLTHGGEAKYSILKEILLRMKYYSEDKNARFILVFIPADVRYSKEKWELARSYGYVVKEDWLSGQSELESRLQEFTREHEIPFLSLTQDLRQMQEEGQSATFSRDIHLNAAGHALAAREIADLVKDTLKSK